jgi:hypothetical protein|tara:strand:- start:422 stop:697 length:276 start_codon:yes stop_codon:yes gene_type:complete
MPHPPSTPLYKVNDKVKVINKSPSLLTANGLKKRSKFTRDNNEIGTIKEVIIEKNITKLGRSKKEYYYLVKVNRPTPIIRKHQSKLKPFHD